MASGREYKCDLDLEVDAEMNPPVGRLDTQNSPLIPCGKGWTPEIQEIFRVSKGKTNGYIISPETHQALFLSGMDYFRGGMVAQAFSYMRGFFTWSIMNSEQLEDDVSRVVLRLIFLKHTYVVGGSQAMISWFLTDVSWDLSPKKVHKNDPETYGFGGALLWLRPPNDWMND